ncbi:MAG: hypothetical protein ACTSPW_11070 [Promethearchaeota archaeon]
MVFSDIIGLTFIIHLPVLALFSLSKSNRSIIEIIKSDDLPYDFYFGIIIGSSIFLFFFNILLYFKVGLDDSGVLIFYLLQIIPFTIYKVFLTLNLWYKAWKNIQDGFARTTPVKAIGYLFIPFFNLYWVFKVFLGFAEDYNSYLNRHKYSLPKLNEGPFLFYSLFLSFGGLFTIIPFGLVFYLLIELILTYTVIPKVCNCINSLENSSALKPV